MRVPDEVAIIMKMYGKDGSIKFPVYETDEFLATNVNALDLDTRGKRALRDCGISTIGDLINNWGGLSKIKGVGVKTVNLIRESLAAYQYTILTQCKQKRFLERIIELNA